MTTPLYSMVEQPDVESPVLVMALKGWIDAGLAAETAMATIVEHLDVTTVARFDGDALLDWRARRPTMHLDDGVLSHLSWDDTELLHARDGAGNDVLLLTGYEPDQQWLGFSEQVVDLVADLGARLVIGLGAYPIAVPHTRPVRVASSASSPELAEGLVRSTVAVPSGVQTMIERRAALRGLEAVGLWGQVPHYVAAMPYPATALALIEQTNRIAGLALPVGDLADKAATSRARIDDLIAQNPEHRAMLTQLEQQVDQEAEVNPLAEASGEELAAELERFLREQGGR